MGIGISLKGLKNKFNELMGRDKKKDDTKKSSESLESKEETRFDDTSPTKSKKTTASTDLDNTKNGASSGSVNSGEVHVEGLGQTTPAENTTPPAEQVKTAEQLPVEPKLDMTLPDDIQALSRGTDILRESVLRKKKRWANKKRVKFEPPPDLTLPPLSTLATTNPSANQPELPPQPLSTALNQPSESELLSPSTSAPLNTDTKQTTLRPGRLPPPPYPAPTQQEGSKAADPEDFEKELKSIIAKANERCLFYDKYVYNEKAGADADFAKDDYARQIYNILMNARMFLSKISEKIYDVEELAEKNKSSVGGFCANMMGFKDRRTEQEQKKAIDEIKKVVEDANEKAASLESKKDKIISKESSRFNALVEKYKDITGKKYEIKNDNMSNFYNSIGDFWSYCVGKELGITDSKRADKLNSAMINIDKEILKNGNKLDEIPDDERLVSLEEALDQKFNIIGRVVLYLEKRKNKEEKKQAAKDSGILGGLVKRFTKTEAEKKTLKLKKCFEDMGKYLIKHKDEEKVKLSDFRKLVKCKKSYSDWNDGLTEVLKNSNVAKCDDKGKIEKMLLMSILFFSFGKFNDEKDIIAACDGLKAGGIKSTDPESFEGKATSIRKAIKGKCATLDMAKDKDDLKNDIKTLCAKYFGLDMSTLTNIGKLFDN